METRNNHKAIQVENLKTALMNELFQFSIFQEKKIEVPSISELSPELNPEIVSDIIADLPDNLQTTGFHFSPGSYHIQGSYEIQGKNREKSSFIFWILVKYHPNHAPHYKSKFSSSNGGTINNTFHNTGTPFTTRVEDNWSIRSYEKVHRLQVPGNSNTDTCSLVTTKCHGNNNH